ncbi:hypothetical protein BDC45DRAFT_448830 [Circinella umbellata]|nr:hypothetical protein BDC45DRAFT_448830 [Circinella umbellata]
MVLEHQQSNKRRVELFQPEDDNDLITESSCSSSIRTTPFSVHTATSGGSAGSTSVVHRKRSNRSNSYNRQRSFHADISDSDDNIDDDIDYHNNNNNNNNNNNTQESKQFIDHATSKKNSSDQYLQLGMQFHEKGELEKATYYWRLSAETESPLGLFFFGVALRHGWGCKKNPTMAVRHLQKAAECAVYDLQTGIAKSTTVAKSELVLAIYELGTSFRHAWGVPRNLVIASYYFEIAANLGDPDAQNDLAFCYLHGHGVKKDLYKSAMYYRLAAKQGQGICGNSWIWKDKYNIVEQEDWNGNSNSNSNSSSSNSIIYCSNPIDTTSIIAINDMKKKGKEKEK